MKPFTESMRYEYPLTKDSVVIDAGCHKGTFSKTISDKYGCNIFAFEPIEEFHKEAKLVLGEKPNIHLFHCGLGAFRRVQKFGVKGDMSGAFTESCETEKALVMELEYLLKTYNLERVDLLKINIEGGEFELLENIIKNDWASIFIDIQVQFHPVVENYKERHTAIREALLETHRLTYDAPWCWENYERI